MIDLDLILAQAWQGAEPGVARQRRLYELLRGHILEGRLAAATLLPASRVLAAELGCARNTVIHAYERLAAEGLVATSRQGTVISAGVAGVTALPHPPSAGPMEQGLPPLSLRARRIPQAAAPGPTTGPCWPFTPGVPALDEFPRRLWQRLCDRAARQQHGIDLGYGPVGGEPTLRQAIAAYVSVARGMRCAAEQVIVTQGTQHSLQLCAQLLADAGDQVWMEHPGYRGASTAFALAGLRTVPMTVDADGMQVGAGSAGRRVPRLIYITPSHQYPLGSVLSLPRRLALLEQARRHGAWVLEDDYDGEFRHDGLPLPAMQGLANDVPVIYLGTFSKSMFPALRIGFMVVPGAAVDRIMTALAPAEHWGHAVAQRALAAFISEGHFGRHVRRMRRLYAARQQALREALGREWPLEATLLGGSCGMHLVLPLPAAHADAAVVLKAHARQLAPRALSDYSSGGPGGFNGLVLGYGHLRAEDAMRHVRHLAFALR